MLLKQRMRTAIVGGGIRGMTLVMLLLDAAIEDVDIYESATVKELGVSTNITVLPQCSARADGARSPRRAYGVGIPTAEHVFYSSPHDLPCQSIAAQHLWFEDGR
jgi:hypothetical protein